MKHPLFLPIFPHAMEEDSIAMEEVSIPMEEVSVAMEEVSIPMEEVSVAMEEVSIPMEDNFHPLTPNPQSLIPAIGFLPQRLRKLGKVGESVHGIGEHFFPAAGSAAERVYLNIIP